MTSNSEACSFISYRLILAFLIHIGFATIYSGRLAMSVTILSMVNHTAISSKNIADLVNETSTYMDGPYVWNKQIQGHILGSFYYGYIISLVPCGWMAEKLGCKKVLMICLGLSSIATILIPVLIKSLGFIMLIITRIITGIGCGSAIPCITMLWTKWAPKDERSKLINISYSGANTGIILSMPLSGILCSTIGWESVFYITGGSTMLWLILCYFFIFDDPHQTSMISEEEKQYIISNLDYNSKSYGDQMKTPWFSIFSSSVVWSAIIFYISVDWGLNTYRSNIPTYFFEVLKLNIRSNGLYSALPFIGTIIVLNIAPLIADILIKKNIYSIRVTRAVMAAFGSIGAPALLISLSFLSSNQSLLAILLLTLGVSISSFSQSCCIVTPMEIAPNFAGTISGICNSIAAITGVVAPYVISLLTKNQTAFEWRNVFYLTSAIYVLGVIIYVIFYKSEVQPWANEGITVLDDETMSKLTVNSQEI